MLWKYSHLHFLHLEKHIDVSKLGNHWQVSIDRQISLKDGVIDYLRHYKHHFDEIEELIAKG